MDDVHDAKHDHGAAVIALMVDSSAAVEAAARLHASLRAGRVRNGWREDGQPRRGPGSPAASTSSDATVDGQ